MTPFRTKKTWNIKEFLSSSKEVVATTAKVNLAIYALWWAKKYKPARCVYFCPYCHRKEDRSGQALVSMVLKCFFFYPVRVRFYLKVASRQTVSYSVLRPPLNHLRLLRLNYHFVASRNAHVCSKFGVKEGVLDPFTANFSTVYY